MYLFKSPICNSWQLNCVANVTLDGSNCLPQCSGLLLTSFYKSEKNHEKNLEELIPAEWNSYRDYKKYIEFPPSLAGAFIIIL